MTETQEQKEARYVDLCLALDCLERLSDVQLVVLRFAIDIEQKYRFENQEKVKQEAIKEEVQLPKINTYRIGKFPILYNRLLTMSGISEEERNQCLMDFLTAENKTKFNNDASIKNSFIWSTMPSGASFWEEIFFKVRKKETGI